MTNEEAIEIIKRDIRILEYLKDDNDPYDVTQTLIDAYDMAIEALEKQMSIDEPELTEDGTLFIDLDIPTEKVKRICLGNPNTNIGGLYYLDEDKEVSE